MNDSELEILEAFADRVLDGSSLRVMESAELARSGYDSGLLLELVSAYCELPAEKHRFLFDVDFPTGGDTTAFTLKITRVA